MTVEMIRQKDSDVDLMIEFLEPISLLKLSEIRIQLEEALGIHVDLIHGPVLKNDLLKIKREVELYAA